MARTKQKVREDVEARRGQMQPRAQHGMVDPTTIGDADGPKPIMVPSRGESSAQAEAGKQEEQEDDEVEEEEEYAVESIVRERTYRNKLQYQVKWVGYEELTWEPAAHLADTSALEEFLERKVQEEAAALAELDESEDDEEDEDDEEASGDDKEWKGGKHRSSPSRKRRAASHSDEDSESEEEDDESDDDDEYVPEGRRRGRARSHSSKRAKPSAARAPPLTDRAKRLLSEEAQGATKPALVEALEALVSAHPETYATARAVLKKAMKGVSRSDDDDDENGDDDDDDDDDDDE